MADSTLFAIFLSKTGNTNLPQDAIQRHVDHLRSLGQAGRLVLCGPFADHPSGLVVVRAKDKEEAIGIAERDPFVRDGFRTFEVRKWLIAHSENKYLG